MPKLKYSVDNLEILLEHSSHWIDRLIVSLKILLNKDFLSRFNFYMSFFLIFDNL